jgi:hypothetical protein
LHAAAIHSVSTDARVAARAGTHKAATLKRHVVTRKLAGESIEAREFDVIRVVGKTDPVRVYELIGRKGDISPKTTELCAHYKRGLAFYRKRK